MTVPSCPIALRTQGRRPDRLQAGCGAKRNPCKKYDNKSEPRRGDRILSYLRHLYSTGINSRGFVLRTSHPACILNAPSGLWRRNTLYQFICYCVISCFWGTYIQLGLVGKLAGIKLKPNCFLMSVLVFLCFLKARIADTGVCPNKVRFRVFKKTKENIKNKKKHLALSQIKT